MSISVQEIDDAVRELGDTNSFVGEYERDQYGVPIVDEEEDEDADD